MRVNRGMGLSDYEFFLYFCVSVSTFPHLSGEAELSGMLFLGVDRGPFPVMFYHLSMFLFLFLSLSVL